MKYIIITGGSGGIGSQITRVLLSANYHVIVIGRSQNNFDLMADRLINNQNLSFYKLDISDKNSVNTFYNDLNKIGGDIFALINAAGVQSPIGKFINSDYNDWIINLSNNFLGTVNMIRGFLFNSNNKSKRKIINFSGGGATSSRPNFSAYAVSKTAIVKFTEILADEIADQNIDINAIAPGAVNTNMLDEVLAAKSLAGEEYALATKRKKSGGVSPKKAVDLCQFLLSDDANGVTGKLISAIWDDYRDPNFLVRLKTDPEFCCLRRIDSHNFDIVK